LSKGGQDTKKQTKFEVLTWKQMYDALLRLAEKIVRRGFMPDVIVGVSRGGWVPARVLCDLLNVPALANVGVGFYEGLRERKSEPKLTQSISMNVSGQKVLVVDEVADTGKSLMLVEDYITKQGAKEVRTATIYTKPWSIIEPDYYEKETSQWIVFPWEIKETVRLVAMKSSKSKKREELEDLEDSGVSRKLTRRFLAEILREKCRKS